MIPAALSWYLSPISPPGAALAGLGLLLVLLYARRCLELGLGVKMIPLLVMRFLAVATVLLVVLGPARVQPDRLEVPLDSSTVQVQLPRFPPKRLLEYLPPPGLWTPGEPETDGRVRLERVSPPLLALYKNRDEIHIRLSTRLMEERALGVELYDLSDSGGRRLLWSEPVKLKPADRHPEVRLPFVPDRLGAMLLGVRLQCPPGLTCEDGIRSLQVQVVRESLRILHLAGHPSWDLRFLRDYLGRHMEYEVISFYVLANQENYQPLPPDEVALIPFPTDELFLSELPGFDLVIIQDFPLGTYFLLREEHLERLAAFVRGGGGLLMLGGDRSFAEGGVRTTPLAGALPVRLNDKPEASNIGEDTPYRARLTPEGARHPITHLVPDSTENQALYRTLPSLSGINSLGTPIEGARTLLTGPKEHPLLLAGPVEKGRVILLATDSLWRWAFPEHSKGDVPQAYATLLENTILWLVKDPRLEVVRFEIPKSEALVAQLTNGRICVRGGSPGRLEGQKLHWQARWVGLEASEPRSVDGEVELDENGCSAFSLEAAAIGGWTLAAHGVLDGASVHGDAVLPVIPALQSEASRRSRRVQSLLPDIFAPVLPGPDLEHRILPDRLTIDFERTAPLWHNPWALLLVALLLVLDWGLRRRFGLI